MRTAHLRQADLNLLVVFTVLAEERNVTRAAGRLLLSQPAVSRALQRLRETFHDDLLSGGEFDPNEEVTTFRVAVTDHASQVLGPVICRTVLPEARKVSFDFVSF